MSAKSTPESPSSAENVLGREFHLAFGVEGTDTWSFGLGAVHALIACVPDDLKPGVVAGSSIGATNALVLARLYGIGSEGDAPEVRREKRLRALRHLVQLYLRTGNILVAAKRDSDAAAIDVADVAGRPGWLRTRLMGAQERAEDLGRAADWLSRSDVRLGELARMLEAVLRKRRGKKGGKRGVGLVKALGLLGRVPPKWGLSILRHWASERVRSWFSPPHAHSLGAIAVDVLAERSGLGEGLLNERVAVEVFESFIRELGLFAPGGEAQDEDLTVEQFVRDSGIRVEVVAADLGLGELVVLPADRTRLLGAVLASTALPVIWPVVAAREVFTAGPTEMPKGPFSDAMPIAQVPFEQVLTRLKELGAGANEDTDERTHLVFGVSPRRARAPELEAFEHRDIVSVAMRALQLQAHSQLRIEEKIADLFQEALRDPNTGPRAWQRLRDFNRGAPDAHQRLISAGFIRVEPSEPLVHESSAFPKPEVVARHAANGCRALIESLAKAGVLESRGGAAPLGSRPCERVTPSLAGGPGASGRFPGVPEICKHCHEVGQAPQLSVARSPDPAWERIPESTPARRWLDALLTEPNAERPLITMAMSGGVFRGVFQVGVVHALAIRNMRPDLIAGASVGTLIGALAAGVLSEEGPAQEETLGRVVQLFRRVDDWVHTERYHTFEQRLLGALGEVEATPADCYRAFRGYDAPSPESYTDTFMRVARGIQQVFGLQPPELMRLWSDYRAEHPEALLGDIKRYLVRALRQYEVGDEVLGAENIRAKLREVLNHPQLGPIDDREFSPAFERVPGEIFPYLLATITDLKKGVVRLVGLDDWCPPDASERAMQEPARMLETLLASSAFPGLFAPLSESQLYPHSGDPDRWFADGGTVNNHPMDEVLRFLRRMGDIEMKREARDASRPLRILGTSRPHLLIVGSLERRITNGWSGNPRIDHVYRRVQALRNNYKLERYARTQKRLRRLTGQVQCEKPPSIVSTHVVSVYPEKLVGTFAFDRAFGFDEEKQLCSMADGCMRTLAALAQARDELSEELGPEELRHYSGLQEPLEPAKQEGSLDGARCHHFEGVTCLFAKLEKKDGRSGVFTQCGKLSPPHQPSDK